MVGMADIRAVSYTHLDVYKRQIVGIALIFVSLLVHILGIQEQALLEMSPVLLSLILIYLHIIRINKAKA